MSNRFAYVQALVSMAALFCSIGPVHSQEPKEIKLPVAPKHLGERVRVTFKVEFAAATGGGTVNLHSMKEWDNPKSFWVILSPAVLDAYQKAGIKDAVSHFSGKTIHVEGVIRASALVKNDKNKLKPLMSILVESPDQIQVGKSRWQSAAFDAWSRSVAALPVGKQAEAVAKKLKELNPGFDGKIGLKDDEPATIVNQQVTEIQVFSNKISDISPFRALGGLRKLVVANTGDDYNGELVDLSPLQGMRLTSLNIQGHRGLSDLSPLKGMPLTQLNIWLTKASDLSPLQGMKLTELNLRSTSAVDLSPLRGMPLISLDCTQMAEVADLTPLQGMKLKKLWINDVKAADLKPLRGMPLEFLEANRMPNVSDLSPLQGMPLLQLEIEGCPKIRDLSPLREIPLKILRCDYRPQRDGRLLRSIRSLEQINGKPVAEVLK
ncbi:MAG: hypothetical protein U0744_07450 [Gemmataceae bacterium]